MLQIEEKTMEEGKEVLQNIWRYFMKLSKQQA